MSKNIRIVNYIDLNGEMILFDSLPEKRQKQAGEKLRDLMMENAGYDLKRPSEKHRPS
ncbi:hypothetical protein LAD12857_41840 [Lacrimispora amygdalina]|uniref:Uncharacterized protein n=1 Tax=Lacrimispora amygdalina TaxID=253257 RepID=A0ABQ5MBT2_9FIRM|nr:hypothetical protein [Clostridium indicum]